jgi:hypothetical protein
LTSLQIGRLIALRRCRDRHKKINAVPPCRTEIDDAVGSQPMPIQEYVVRLVGGLWAVRLDDRLLSGQATQREALDAAEALGHAATLRGEPWKILIGDYDAPTEFPIEARGRRPLFRA